MKRDGKLLEDEYRSEVLKYMYDMEVRDTLPFFPHKPPFPKLTRPFSLAIDDLLCHFNGPAARDQMAHAALSC
jgi:hypothetical protein